MHDTAFAVAARPARFVILGLPMQPYSIGHEILLLAQGNRLLYTGFDSIPVYEKRAAIIRACLICCRSWRENHKPHRWLKVWQWVNRNTDYALAIADFKNYRESGSTFPPAPEEEAEAIAAQMIGEEPRRGRELGGPYLARLYNFVCGLPYREHGETAFDFPLGLANFLYRTKLECDGDLKIENAKEVEIRNEMEGHRKEIEREVECPH